MAKVKIVVEVEVNKLAGRDPDKDDDAFEFVSIKCADQSLCMLPKDVPAPRRLAKDLARAAQLVITGKVPEGEWPESKKNDDA